MYSIKENVNLLTQQLVKHRVKHAVLCPGSRNMPIVNNLAVCPEIIAYGQTDERSAGFYALGITEATDELTAVCVTSGTALLNLLPAVAEATYQRRGFVVISADRPEEWIGQGDGQTIEQVGALGKFVSMSVAIPEIKNKNDRWLCNRRLNEALTAVRRDGMCVHINVPISEPFFDCHMDLEIGCHTGDINKCHTDLFTPNGVHYIQQKHDEQENNRSDKIGFISGEMERLVEKFKKAENPMIVMGQTRKEIDIEAYRKTGATVVCEQLASGEGYMITDMEIEQIGDWKPDLVVYGGGTLVSKALKNWLRTLNCEFWQVDEYGEMKDTFMHQTGMVMGRMEDLILGIKDYGLGIRDSSTSEATLSIRLDTHVSHNITKDNIQTDTRRNTGEEMTIEEGVVREFEKRIGKGEGVAVHYGNSMSVRYGCRCAEHYIYVNRGINGIEGSMSTAAGFSLAYKGRVYLVIGDLSFFYDNNALWNRDLGGNFRVLLLNNGGGDIFKHLKGLETTDVRDRYVCGEHGASAKGICEAYNIRIKDKGLRIKEPFDIEDELNWLMETESDRPMVLEVRIRD